MVYLVKMENINGLVIVYIPFLSSQRFRGDGGFPYLISGKCQLYYRYSFLWNKISGLIASCIPCIPILLNSVRNISSNTAPVCITSLHRSHQRKTKTTTLESFVAQRRIIEKQSRRIQNNLLRFLFAHPYAIYKSLFGSSFPSRKHPVMDCMINFHRAGKPK